MVGPSIAPSAWAEAAPALNNQDNYTSWLAGDAVCDAPQEGVWALGCHRMH